MGQRSPGSAGRFGKDVAARRAPRVALLAVPLALAALALLAAPAAAGTLCVGTSAGCDATYASADAALAAAGAGDRVVIRGQDLAGLTVSGSGLDVDARLNRWGTDSWRAAVASVHDLGAGNTIRALPFLRASDGQQDPPSPSVVPGSHCASSGFVPLDLHDALACAHAGGFVLVRPSADALDPVPPGLGPYTIFKNRAIVINALGEPELGAEDERLDGLTVCSSPDGSDECDASARAGTVLNSMSGDTVVVKADSITLRGFTVLVSGEASPGENHGVEVPEGMVVDRLRVLQNVFRPDALAGQAEAENGVRGRMTGARVEDNEFRGFAAGVFFRPYGADNEALHNLFETVGTGVLTWSPGTTVMSNTFRGALMGLDVAEVQGDPTTSGDGNALTLNDLTGARIGVRNRAANSAVTVDARLNTWGTDDWRTIPPRIDNTGAGNRVLFLPFVRASDGDIDPPPVVVEDADHCGVDEFLSIGEALACAHPGGTVRVPPSVNTLDPTPRLESVAIDANNLGESLTGLTLCASGDGTACDGGLREGVVLDASGISGTALTVKAADVTVQGMTIRVTDNPGRVVVADGSSGFTLADNHVQAGELDPLPLTPTPDTTPSSGASTDYFLNPFVQQALGSEAFAALQAEFGAGEGFLFAAPVLTPVPHIGVAYAGAAPAALAGHASSGPIGGAPVGGTYGVSQGFPFLAYEGVQPQNLMQRLPDDLVTYPMSDDAALSTPVTLAATQGIGPGTFVIMRNPDGNFRCTANFVWRNQTTGDLFLGAAGHCFSQAGAANSAQRSWRIEVCVLNCVTDTVRCGTVTCTPQFGAHTVILRNCPHALNTLVDELPSAPGTGKCRGLYSSGDNGAGQDFGAVQIPSQFYPLVRFDIPNFGGPTGTISPGPALGQFVVHYGHGAAFGELFPTEARAGAVLGTQSTGQRSHFTFLGAAAPGDSGSDVAVGKLRSGQWFTGERAAGILTHIALINTVQDPIKPPGATIATTIPRAITMAANGQGMNGGLGSVPSQRYNFCLMTIAADCLDVTPVVGAGVSASGASGLSVEGNTVAMGLLNSEVSPPADAIRGSPLSGASIEGNTFLDWAGHGVAANGGSGNTVAANDFQRGCGGVLLLGSSANRLEDNAFGALACQGVHVSGTSASTAGNVLRENELRAPPVAVRATGSFLNVDARLNDWGDYDHRTLPRRVLSEGTANTVRQVPFIDADGFPEPPLVQRWNGAVATPFLGIQDAHNDAATVSGSLLQVPSGTLVPVPGGQAEKHARTPWLESVLLSKSGVTLCGQQLSRADPCAIAGPAKPAIDATGIGTTGIRVTGSGVTVQGMTVRVATEPAKAIDASGAAGVVLRDNTVEAGPGAAPGEVVGGVLPVATAPLPLRQYFEHPFVAATWGTAALAAIQAAHAGEAGLAAVLPSSHGHVALVYTGDAPDGVADGEEQGLPVKVYEHVTAEALAEPIEDYDPEALGITVLAEDDFDVETGAPSGPNAPRTLEGIGPGSHLLILWGGSGFRCTANFVFKDSLGDYYLGTAGHCVFNPAQTTQPDTDFAGYLQPTSIQVCVAGCQGGTVSLSEAGVGTVLPRQGTFVNLGASRVLFGQRTSGGNGFGEDFAWIRIPAAFHAQLRPYEWFWGGPTGSAVPDSGTPVVHYGHGRFLGETPFTQGRAGILATTSLLGPGSYEGLGWVTGGDSGSASLTGALRVGQRLVGDKAIGDLTHSIVTVGAPLFIGTRVDYALAFLEANTGSELTLVTESISVIPAPVSGAVGIDISNSVGAVVRDNALVGGAGQTRPSAGVQGFNADDATIAGNEFRAWQGSGVSLDGGASGNDVDDNRFGEGCTGVSLGDSPSNTLRRNSFAGLACKGVLVTSAGGGSASDGNVLRLNTFRGVGTPLQVENQDGITVDARANDWGVYEWQLVARQAINNGGDNDVPLVPFLDAEGTLEPGLITVSGGTCAARAPEAPETACGFLNIAEALAFSAPDSTVLVQGSGHAWNPTPRFGQLVVSQDGVTVCATPEGGAACAPSPDTAILDAGGEGSVLVMTGTGSTVRGFSLLAGEDGIAGVDLTGSTGAGVRDNVIAAGSGAVSSDPLAPASVFSGSGAGSFQDPWTREVLASEEFAALVAEHEDDEGFVAAVPVQASRSIALLYQDAPPAGAGRGETVLGARVTASSSTLQPLARRIPDDVARQIVDKAQAPDGPQAPGAPDGIGPGTLLIISRPDGTFGCTANWVYRDAADPGEVYLGAAGHCFLAAGVDEGANPPATVIACLRGCDVDDLGLGAFGEFVLLGSVPYAIQQGEALGADPTLDPLLGAQFCQVGCDFGVVRVPPSLAGSIRPWMWFWRSPTGVDRADTGDVLVQYGYGLGVGMTFPTQARAYVALGTQSGNPPSGARSLSMYGPAAPGDSGSAIATASMPPGEVLRGDKAAGILTHIVLFGNSTEPAGGDPLMPTGAIVGTTVERGIQLVQSRIGLALTLVTEDEELAPPPPPPPEPPVVEDVGVQLAGSSGATVAGNDISVFGGDAALGWSDDAATLDATVVGNAVFAGTIGGRVEGDGAIVRDNDLVGPGPGDVLADRFGLLLTGDAEDYLVEGNTITDWEHAGIYVASPAGAGALRGNTLSSIGRSAILVSNDAAANAVLIEGNAIAMNGLRGINLEQSVGTVVNDNTFLLNPVNGGPAAPGSGVGVWVQGAHSPRLNRNVFQGSGTAAIAFTDLVLEDGTTVSEPSDPVLRRNLMRLDGNAFALTLSEEVDGLTVDARLNDWGVYNFRLLPLRVLDLGSGNTVRQVPFLLADGSSEPPSPTVAPGTHCASQGVVPIGLAEALECAHAGGLVVLHPSANATDPTPWPESVTIEANSEGEVLAGLTLCSGPLGVADCSQPRADGVVLEGEAGPAVTVKAPGVRLKGLGFAGQGVAVLAERALAAEENHWNTYRLSRVQARIGGPQAAHVPVVPFLDRDARTPILPPTADFAASLAQTDRLTAVRFTDLSAKGTRPLEAWTWSFGDGAGSGEASPAHTYATLGTMAVSLVVRDDAELTSAAAGQVVVVNLAPTASFTFGPDPSNRAEPTLFTDASADPDGDVVAWSWDFGGDDTSSLQDPSHQFERLGLFPVSLTVADSDGGTATFGLSVPVVNLVPTAAFTWGPEVPALLQPVEFDDLSVDLDGPITRWAWDFGDGLTSDQAEPVHVFAKGGWHTVTLEVTDLDGVAVRATRELYVCAPGGDPGTLLEDGHLRIELEACIRVNGVEWPF